MTIVQKYIAKTILVSTMLVLFVLLGIHSFIDFVQELNKVGEGLYKMIDAISYMALTMPKRIYELLPIAALLGSVLGLGSLASQSELVVMRAAGISIQQINKAVMFVALFLMIIAFFVGEVIRPPAEQYAREIKSTAKADEIEQGPKHGFWIRDGQNFTHIGRILANGHFADLSIYEFDNHERLRVATKAAQAKYDEETWILSDVVQSLLNEEGVKTRTIKQARWESELSPNMIDIVIVPAEFLPVWDLSNYIHYLDDNHQSVEHYKIVFWGKVMMPISSAVMVFLAVPFIFGPLRSSPMGGRIVAGALVGIGFYLFNQSFQQMGLVFGFIPWLSAATPTLLFAFLGWYLMKRIY